MQKKFTFDKTTMIKVGKGALIAFTGAGALAVLNYIGTLEIDNPLIASFVVWVVPVATNTIKEYIKGDVH